MTKILDPGANPILGRVRAVNCKHRLRKKYWEEVEDWPEGAQSIDVLDEARLDATDHYPNSDHVVIVSQRLLDVLKAVVPDLESFELAAGSRTVHLVMPMTARDVMYERDGDPKHSRSGYSVVDGKDMRVSETPSAALTPVRNTGLFAVADELVEAAADAGINWDLHDVIPHYRPFRDNPYHVFRRGPKAAVAQVLVAQTAWPEIPEQVPHPFEGMPTGEFTGDLSAAWTKRAHQTSKVERCALVRFSSGLPLPEFSATLDEDLAKSKLKKRWKATTTTGCLAIAGLPCVSAAIRDRLLEAGVEAEFQPLRVTDVALEQSTEFFVVQPTHVVDWIDWPDSDVGLDWRGFPEHYYDLVPTEACRTATSTLVRVAGSNLLLVHESIAALLPDEEGFRLSPLQDRAVARTAGDSISAD